MPAIPAIRVIPVLDLSWGIVVQAIAGRREQYQPLVSPLCPTVDALAVASAIRAIFGLGTVYLADLDAIAGGEPNWQLFASLQSHGFRLWVDAGVRSADQAVKLAQTGIDVVVIGLETVREPSELGLAVEAIGPERLAFSLDLKAGRPLGSWGNRPIEIAQTAIAAGIKRLIVLDLANVGLGQGVGTEPLLAELAARFPGLELIAGGGIRGPEDLVRLKAYGVTAALVASALHNGTFKSGDFK